MLIAVMTVALACAGVVALYFSGVAANAYLKMQKKDHENRILWHAIGELEASLREITRSENPTVVADLALHKSNQLRTRMEND